MHRTERPPDQDSSWDMDDIALFTATGATIGAATWKIRRMTSRSEVGKLTNLGTKTAKGMLKQKNEYYRLP